MKSSQNKMFLQYKNYYYFHHNWQICRYHHLGKIYRTQTT